MVKVPVYYGKEYGSYTINNVPNDAIAGLEGTTIAGYSHKYRLKCSGFFPFSRQFFLMSLNPIQGLLREGNEHGLCALACTWLISVIWFLCTITLGLTAIPMELVSYILTPIFWCELVPGINCMHDADTGWYTRSAGMEGEGEDNKLDPQSPCLAFFNCCLETTEYTEEEEDVEKQTPGKTVKKDDGISGQSQTRGEKPEACLPEEPGNTNTRKEKEDTVTNPTNYMVCGDSPCVVS